MLLQKKNQLNTKEGSNRGNEGQKNCKTYRKQITKKSFPISN